MKKITLTVETSDKRTITHSLELSQDSTWMYQLEMFRKFLLAQGYYVDKRIAILEPTFEGSLVTIKDSVIDMFYEQIEEAGWQGEVMPQDLSVN